MLSLAEKYWGWRAIQSEKQEAKRIEREKLAEQKRKYGKWMDQANKHKDSALWLEDEFLTTSILKAAESGVKSRDVKDEHYSKIEFNDGTIIKFWVANAMYAYCARGEITISGQTTKWDNRMPKFFVCFLLRELVEPA